MHRSRTTGRKLSSSDLAINGGTAMFEQDVHVGGPNVPGRDEFLALAGGILDSRQLTNNGPLVRRLEEEIAERLGVEHCIAVSSGTSGLELVMETLDLSGEVIVPSYTFVASAHAITRMGLEPVFVEIDERNHLIDLDAVRAAIGPRTSAILAVHLWGQSANANALEDLAREHGVRLVFDAAHAFGSTYDGAPVGRRGDAEVFSFHSTKFFNTFEGGAVTTDHADLAHELRLRRNFGFAGIDTVVSVGTNAKLPEISAAMGLANLKYVDQVIDVNSRNRSAYAAGLSRINGIELLPYDPDEFNNNQYVIAEVLPHASISRDDLVETLRAERIMARKYFWPSCHRMAPYRFSPPPDGFALPVTEMVADRVLVLPTGMSVESSQIEAICEVIRLAAPER